MNFSPNLKNKAHNQLGYTLLFATLTAALVLGVAAFILGIARKQYILSSTARDSIYAFYAADSAVECLAKANKTSAILSATSTDNVAPDTYTILCANNPGINVQYVSNNPNGSTYTNVINNDSSKIWGIKFNMGFAAPPNDPTISANRWGCASTTADLYNDNNTGAIVAVVVARGYNLCTYDAVNGYKPNTSSPRTVERALTWILK